MNVIDSTKKFMRSKGSDMASAVIIGIAVLVVLVLSYFIFWADVSPGGFAWDVLSGIVVITILAVALNKLWPTGPKSSSQPAAGSPVHDMLVETRELEPVIEAPLHQKPNPQQRRIEAVEEEMELRQRRLFKRSRVHATSREKIQAAKHKFGVYIPNSLILQDDEIVSHAQRLHWMKVAVPGVVFIATGSLYFYVEERIALQPLKQVLILLAVGSLILYQYYRIILEIVTSISTLQYLMALAVLVIAGVILWNYLIDWAEWVLARFVDLAELIGGDIGNMMILLTVMSGLIFVSELVLWWVNPAIATNKRLIIMRGVGIFVTKSAALKSITDQELKTVAFFSFGSIEIETPGQKQSITKVQYFPHDLYSRLRSGVDSDGSEPE